jgi:hypothetical protein
MSVRRHNASQTQMIYRKMKDHQLEGGNGRILTHALMLYGFETKRQRTTIFLYQNIWGVHHHVRGRGILDVKAITGVIVPHVVRNRAVIVSRAMCSTSYANYGAQWTTLEVMFFLYPGYTYLDTRHRWVMTIWVLIDSACFFFCTIKL